MDMRQEELTNASEKIGPVAGLTRSLAEMISDIFEIADLQAQLTREDLRKALPKARHLLLIATTCALMLIGTLPVLASGVSGMVASEWGWKRWQADTIVGLSLVLIATLGETIAILYLLKLGSLFSQSRAELANNLAWLKSLFHIPS